MLCAKYALHRRAFGQELVVEFIWREIEHLEIPFETNPLNVNLLSITKLNKEITRMLYGEKKHTRSL
jgi:type III secretion system FlhB-like substrate exporter